MSDETVIKQLKSLTRNSGGRLLISAEYDYVRDIVKIGRFATRVSPEQLGRLVEAEDTGAKVTIRVDP